jgi:electron transfer flavoprotein alpha/beta subunit
MGVMRAMKAQIPRVTLDELGVATQLPLALVGYSGAPARPPVTMLEGEPAAVAADLARLLREEAKVL